MFYRYIISGACKLIKVTGKSSAPEFGPKNALVDDGENWILPEDVSGNPDGRLTYIFSCDVEINGFYISNIAGENEEGTADYTIYAGEAPDNWDLVVESELDIGQSKTVGIDGPIKAKAIGFVVKSFHGSNGGLNYFWYY